MTTKADSAKPDFVPDGATPDELDESQWETISEEDVDEIKQSFDEIGESFTGVYDGFRQMETANGKLTQYKFTVGELHYFINATYNLMQGMSQVNKGELTRITWVGERDTGQESLMKIFRVDVAKRGARRGKVR